MIIRGRNNPFGFWNENVLNDLFDESFCKRTATIMRTDIKEEIDKFVFDVDLPGYKKDDIKISIEDGYLTIEADYQENSEAKDENTYLRKERKLTNVSRSYFVSDADEDAIEANYHNGVLNIVVMKKKAPAVEEKKYITIK